MNPLKKWLSLIVCLSLLISLGLMLPQTAAVAEDTLSPYQTTFIDDNGDQITKAIFPSPPPLKLRMAMAAAEEDIPDVHIAGVANSISNVPAFDWSYGCSATSAAMLFGYYDRTGYSNMYAGPINGGVCPLTNADWDTEECPLSATHQGYDGLAT